MKADGPVMENVRIIPEGLCFRTTSSLRKG